LYGKAPVEGKKIKEPWKLLIPIYLLVVIIVILGVFPALALNLISSATTMIP
jgi:formate hydrogenlyase subunit 3/multisubunit Na+/H+ antiporter MnhD subunit